MNERFTVLVIDDDRDLRDTLREVLESEGFPVISVANGGEAIDLLVSGARPGLIVLDLMMPVMSGWEFLSALRGDRALVDIPVAVISASGGKPPPEAATTVLRKPIDLDVLLDLVHRCCTGPAPRHRSDRPSERTPSFA